MDSNNRTMNERLRAAQGTRLTVADDHEIVNKQIRARRAVTVPSGTPPEHKGINAWIRQEGHRFTFEIAPAETTGTDKELS